ncbi:MAG: hypothetical protein ACKO7B_18005, partial [Flavobacteriales bacterium]
MKSDASGFVFYLALLLVASLLLLRILRAGKKGGKALVLDILYLCTYCFRGGIVVVETIGGRIPGTIGAGVEGADAAGIDGSAQGVRRAGGAGVA